MKVVKDVVLIGSLLFVCTCIGYMVYTMYRGDKRSEALTDQLLLTSSKLGMASDD